MSSAITKSFSKNNFQKIFKLRYTFFTIFFLLTPVLLTVPSPLIFFMAGEFSKEDDIARFIRSNKSVMYGFASQDDSSFKRELYKHEKPKILALGSSRVMQFRQEAFREKFYNGGGLMNSIAEGHQNLQELLPVHKPDLIILGIDVWWFNEKFQKPVNINSSQNQINIARESEDFPFFYNLNFEGSSIHEFNPCG